MKTHILFSVPFFPENLTVYDKMSKNVVKPEGLQLSTRRIGVACWISKMTRAQADAHALAHPPAHARTQAHT
jgi:hypothetical protein